MTSHTHEATPVIPLPAAAARAITTAGAALTVVSTFLAWTWTSEFPGDLTVTGYPGGLQVLTLVSGALTLLYAVAGYGIRGLGWLNPTRSHNSTFFLALGTLATTWYAVISITAELGGVVNLEPGGFLAAAATLITFLGALGLPLDRKAAEELPRWNWFLAVIVGLLPYLFWRHIRLAGADGRPPEG